MANVKKNLNQIQSTEEILLDEIKAICVGNPNNEIANLIKSKIEAASIPIQMDKDLMRRLTDPSCNPLDVNFNFPLSALIKNYA